MFSCQRKPHGKAVYFNGSVKSRPKEVQFVHKEFIFKHFTAALAGLKNLVCYWGLCFKEVSSIRVQLENDFNLQQRTVNKEPSLCRPRAPG